MLVNNKYISVRFSEPTLRERNRALSILLDMSNFLSTSMDCRQVLEGALARVLKWFDLNSGRIYLMDEGGESMTLAASEGVDTEGLEKVKITEGFSGKAARTRSFIAQHVSELGDRERAAFLEQKGFKVIICVPLLAMGEVVGVMNLAADRVIHIDQADIDLLIAIGNQIAVAANNTKLYADLQSKMKELKVQKEAIEFFAYSISHDLKSPAIGIYGLTRRLYKQHCDTLQGTGIEYCEQILKAAEQIVRLVDRINAYIMAKEAPLNFESVPVKELTESIRTEFADALSKRNVKWSEPEKLPTIKADRICITRVLRNLVDNALKYGGKALNEISIAYRDEGDHHVISVGDNGVALTEADTERLFQLFQRHRTSKGTEGTGLGLATVKEIAERHHGRVWLDTKSGEGTTFCFSIAKGLENKSEKAKSEDEEHVPQ